MSSPRKIVKLQRGFGQLELYSPHGNWNWRYWNKYLGRRSSASTGQCCVEEARRWVMQQVAKRQAQAGLSAITPILFSTVASEYAEVRRQGLRCRRLRSASLRKINTTVRVFERFVGPSYSALMVGGIDAGALDRFLLAQAERVSTGVANSHLEVISQILGFAVKRSYLPTNPAKKVERLYDNGDEEPRDSDLTGWPCPTAEDVRRIVKHAKPSLTATGERVFNGSEQGRPIYKGVNQNNYAPLYSALAMSGLRIGEARFLTWEDVDFDRSVFLIRPGRKNGIFWQPKTRQSIRRVPIVPELRAILLQLRASSRRDHWVFETRRGTQLSSCHPTLRFRAICNNLGFEKRYVLHSLRKFWASTVAAQGMEPMLMIKALGHSDLKLIMSTYYAQRDDVRMVAAAAAIDFSIGAVIDDPPARYGSRIQAPISLFNPTPPASSTVPSIG